jgi:hypothetical protein
MTGDARPMHPTNPAGPLPAPDRRRRWVKTVETGLVVVLTVVLGLVAALGLVAIGFLVLFAYAMNDHGSNK